MSICSSCRFWGFPDETDGKSRSCVLFSDQPSYIPGTFVTAPHPLPDTVLSKRKAFVLPFAGADGATLETDADFGCVQWESK